MKNGPYEMVIAPVGYPGKRYRDRYAYEHHVVWWQNTGSVPPPGFDVHHKNEQKRDNRFDNLELLSKSEHTKHHAPEAMPKLSFTCGWCLELFKVSERIARQRLKKAKHDKLFCSRSCGAKHQNSLQ